MSVGAMTALLFGSLLILLALGVPIAFCLGGTAVAFAWILWGPQSLCIMPLKALEQIQAFVLIAVPLFVVMANVLETAGVADDLYEMMYRWTGPLRGGLAIGTVFICTIFAAMCGISAAATVTMGVIALPSMLKRGYNKSIALGCISAGGALGVLIPPSVMMIIFGLLAGESVGRLFLGGVFPGLMLSAFFMLYIAVRSALQPDLAPSLPPEERAGWSEKFISLRAVILPILLVIGVLGSIFAGIATPTEASAVGATGAIICAAVYRKLKWKNLKDAAYRSIGTTAMLMWILIGASFFTAIYQGLGAAQLMNQIVAAMQLSPMAVLAAMQIVLFILGCLLDPTGIMMITMPVFLPLVRALNFDVVWFGVLFVLNMEMGYLTPPFGFNLFYLKGVAPEGVTMMDIYRSITPFVMLQFFGLVLCIMFPQIIMWLPNLMFGVSR